MNFTDAILYAALLVLGCLLFLTGTGLIGSLMIGEGSVSQQLIAGLPWSAGIVLTVLAIAMIIWGVKGVKK